MPVAEHLRGPWPDGRALLRREVDAFLVEVADGSIDDLPTRCPPWTVADVTIHVAETLRRFDEMIDRARDGDLDPPFAPDETDAENLRAVAAFDGDPVRALGDAADGLLERTTDLSEPVAHQIGIIPASLQVLFALFDITLHHDDVLDATGRRYAMPDDVVEALRPVAVGLFGVAPDEADLATVLMVSSGRPPV